jgi:hypothetical protein
MTVGAANAAGFDAHQNILRSRNGLVHFPQRDAAHRFQAHSSHRFIPCGIS